MEPFEQPTPASKPNQGNLPNSLEQVATGAHRTIDKVSDVARPAVDRIASGAHQTVDKLSDAAETLESKRKQLNEVQSRWIEETRNYVHENPVMALGLAAGIGYLLSRLFSSR